MRWVRPTISHAARGSQTVTAPPRPGARYPCNDPRNVGPWGPSLPGLRLAAVTLVPTRPPAGFLGISALRKFWRKYPQWPSSWFRASICLERLSRWAAPNEFLILSGTASGFPLASEIMQRERGASPAVPRQKMSQFEKTASHGKWRALPSTTPYFPNTFTRTPVPLRNHAPPNRPAQRPPALPLGPKKIGLGLPGPRCHPPPEHPVRGRCFFQPDCSGSPAPPHGPTATTTPSLFTDSP